MISQMFTLQSPDGSRRAEFRVSSGGWGEVKLYRQWCKWDDGSSQWDCKWSGRTYYQMEVIRRAWRKLRLKGWTQADNWQLA